MRTTTQPSTDLPTPPLSVYLARLEETIKALMDLLKQETKAVDTVDVSTFTQLQSVKNDLYELYHQDMRALMTRKDELKALPEESKNRLRRFETDLAAITHGNKSALERASATFTRLRDRMINLTKESVMKSRATYGANGAPTLNTRRAISTGHQERV